MFDHLLEYGAAAEKYQLEVIQKNLVPLLFGNLLHWHQWAAKAGAVDEHIDLAEPANGFVHKGIDLPIVATIGGDGDRFPALPVDRLCDAIELRLHLFVIIVMLISWIMSGLRLIV